MRSTVGAAPLVCSVPMTRMPISAAVTAMLIVSRSRNSPTRMTSGSSRKAECSAAAKLGLCTPISRWLMRQLLRWCTNSIGSSMVRMWPFTRVLMSSIIAASVVDLPEPVLPVTRISPLLARHIWRTASGIFSSSSVQRLGGNGAEHGAHAVQLAHDVDAEAASIGEACRRSRRRPWPRSDRAPASA